MTATLIGYKARISGIVYAAEPIYSPEAYARAVFGDRRDDVVIGWENNILYFSVSKPVLVDARTPVGDLVDGLITGDDRNVEWTIKLG